MLMLREEPWESREVRTQTYIEHADTVNVSYVSTSSTRIEQREHQKEPRRKCKGYGKKADKCTNYAINKNISYCEECYAECFYDSVLSLFMQQGYLQIHRSGPIAYFAKTTWITTQHIVIIMHACPDKSLDRLTINDLLDYASDRPPSGFEKCDCVLVLDNAQGVNSDAEELAYKKGIKIIYQDELERTVLDFSPYEDRVQRYYETTKMQDYVELRIRPYGDELKKVIFDFLADPISEDDDGSSSCRLILGDFGVGKTSFCYSLARDMIRFAKTKDWTAHGYYPIVLCLRDLNSDRSIDKLLTSTFVDEMGVEGFTLATFRRYLHNNKILMIFDGFDEITKRLTVDVKYDVYKAICEYAEGDTKIIVTCRPNFFQTKDEMRRLFNDTPMFFEPQSSPPLRFTEIEIDEFNDNQIREYLDHKNEQLAAAGLNAEEFLRAIGSIHDLYDLARRPVLLGMLLDTLPEILDTCATNANPQGNRVSAASLYDTYTSKWIEREMKKGRTLFSREHKAAFCTFLAFRMFGNGEKPIPMTEITSNIQEQYKNLTPEDVEAYAHEIRSGSFFVSNGDGTFGFVHRSFMEYFVAKELVRMLSTASFDLEQCLGNQLFSTEIGRFAADIVRDRQDVKRQIAERLNQAQKSDARDIQYNACLLLSKIGEGAALLSEGRYFRGFDLANIELKNTTVTGCDFTGANLARAKMQDVVFEDCHFCSADLTEATLERCDFIEINAEGSRWVRSESLSCQFSYTSLAESNFSEATVTGCTFEGADLSAIETPDAKFSNNVVDDYTLGVPYEMQ